MMYLRRFYRSIKNLIRWFPVIWEDRDWDDGFLYIILQKKLKHMEKFFRSDKAIAVNADKNADDIKLAIETLQRFIEDNYLEEATKEYDKIYGDRPLYAIEESKLKSTELNEQKEMFRKCCYEAEENRKKDKQFIFEHIYKNIDNWWD